jgi:hypothetical protein
MNWWNAVQIGWVDKNNRACTSQIPTQNQSDAVPAALVTLATTAQELSVCKLKSVQFVVTLKFAGAASDGDYPTVNDRVTFNARTARTAPQLVIPGPKASILKPNRRDVNMADPHVVAWVSAVLASLGSSSGSPIYRVDDGVRTIAGVGTPF